MPKFFVKENQINEGIVSIIGDDVNHISNVLRMKVGDVIQICDIDNVKNFKVELSSFEKKQIIGQIVEEIESNAESNVSINIFQGIPKSDKMELIIQKCTELGSDMFTPVEMDRCVSKISQKDECKKIERWQKIAEVAAKQSGRDIIPKVNNVVKIKDICDSVKNYDVIFVPYENAKDYSFNEAVQSLKTDFIKCEKNEISIGIVIGPEGGFEESEIVKLEQSGAKVITLGNRILRTETVAMAMTSVIMFEFGGSI